MERSRGIDLGKAFISTRLLAIAFMGALGTTQAKTYLEPSVLTTHQPSLTSSAYEEIQSPFGRIFENNLEASNLPTIKQGDTVSITLPNGRIIYPSSALNLSNTDQMHEFEEYPNHLGFKYLSSENTPQYNLIEDKGPILWLSLHTSGHGYLPGNRFLQYETSFYGDPMMYFKSQKLQVRDIRDIYVKDFIENDWQYNNFLLSAADSMQGHVYFQLCKGPYFYDAKGDYVGENIMLIGAEKLP